MTIEHAEALYYLALHHYSIAGHGERASAAKWVRSANVRVLECDVNSKRQKIAQQIEERCP